MNRGKAGSTLPWNKRDRYWLLRGPLHTALSADLVKTYIFGSVWSLSACAGRLESGGNVIDTYGNPLARCEILCLVCL